MRSLCCCGRHDESPVFEGRAESFYEAGPNDAVSGFTRFNKGQPGQWQSVEMILKCNTQGRSDGELALWLGGRPATHIGPGTKTGPWTGDGFEGRKEGEQTFEGFRWRTVSTRRRS